ncbi:hypothetical protein [Methylophilus sp. YYY-1]|uniref:hypothetical protein n=1 Tax=Methylophilus sp. YYY-1 TaxID=2682087 RepID=UPI0023B2B3C3|nr:hypothetical protein [Methylophilus sp. YYY-1]MDF0377710.1 hypothetical protein [Methylophilus sp. YYY-1]
MAGTRPRTQQEILNSFNHNCDYLYRSCRAFDAGMENEAIRLSSTLRTLLHQTNKSNSILNQMNKLRSLNYVDSGIRKNILIQTLNQNATPGFKYNFHPIDTGLVIPGFMNNEYKFVAPLVKNRFPPADPKYNCVVPVRSYSEWWEDKFIEVSNGNTFSRKDIVLALANKEGGNHLDPEIEVKFDQLYHDNLDMFGSTNDAPLESAMPNIAYATVRQITFELMATFDENLGTNLLERTHKNMERPLVTFMPMMTLYAK